MGTVFKHYSEQDLKQLTEIELNKLLENENKLFTSIGSNLHDKGEKILKHIDLINNIIKEKKLNNNSNNNILNFNKQTNNNLNSNNYYNKNMENNVLNSMGGLNLHDRSSNNNNNNNNNINNQHHHIKQLSVEESSQILQSNIIDSKISSLDKKFNEFGVDSPNCNRRRKNENSDSNILEDEELNDILEDEEHDYVNPDDIDDEVDSIDPFDDEPYDQGFNYKLHDEFHYYDDDT
ncbi:hypothetical protein DDB_G0275213 [Dictyostelium discoideum AX4]|uniref:Uncharacterized protein n=1 Tax=Dictyostelium discoideum TaxID=44689 RepID=Q554G8_DICDI|nr:hypothetical protein DDB_G0275213 [Dictyostelium discoideum AX4]EAL69887.1 hypothetical protein DDB_G0275213 [Dictyostelium discoideum AX4]|eukprot:XP_643743.1 hypothetical protein DDB_G0275213 [Dictyostelium discoideum AX4]